MKKGPVPISRIRRRTGKHSRNPETRIRNFDPRDGFRKRKKTGRGMR